MLIAQAVFLLERRQQTDREKDATGRPTHDRGYTAGAGNKQTDKPTDTKPVLNPIGVGNN